MSAVTNQILAIELRQCIDFVKMHYSAWRRATNRYDKLYSFNKIAIYLESVKSYLELEIITEDVKNEIVPRLSRVFINMAEDSTMEYRSNCLSPIEKYFDKVRDINSLSILYGLTQRVRDLDKMEKMMVSKIGMFMATGDKQWPGINNLLNGSTEYADWIKKTESSIKEKVESLVNPNGLDLKEVYENLIRDRILKNMDGDDLPEVVVRVDLDKNSYVTRITDNNSKTTTGSVGTIADYWRTLLNEKKVKRALSLSSRELSDEFANFNFSSDCGVVENILFI